MPQELGEDTKTILLLCASLKEKEKASPLATREYSSLARWLHDNGKRPKDMQQREIADQAAFELGLDASRLNALLARGVLLGAVLEQCQRNGLWVIGRADADYPSRYRKNLGDKAPPLLFGAGDRILLERGGLAIVGSRKADAAGLEFAMDIARQCASGNIQIISGAAKGVDLAAMNSSLECDGCAVGVVADNLLKKARRQTSGAQLATGALYSFQRVIQELHSVLAMPWPETGWFMPLSFYQLKRLFKENILSGHGNRMNLKNKANFPRNALSTPHKQMSIKLPYMSNIF